MEKDHEVFSGRGLIEALIAALLEAERTMQLGLHNYENSRTAEVIDAALERARRYMEGKDE